MSQFFVSGCQSIGASASVLPKNTQGWSPSEWTGWISLQSKGLSRVFSNTTVQKHHFFSAQLSLWSKSHIYTWLLEKSIAVVQSLRHVWLFVTPWTATRQASLSFTINWSLLKLMSTELVMPSDHLILCHPLLLLPSIFPSISVRSNESVLCIRWPKYWSFSFSFSISPTNEYSGLISFRMDWFDLLAIQGTLKRVFNTIIEKHQFFGTQLSLSSNSHIHTWLLEKP